MTESPISLANLLRELRAEARRAPLEIPEGSAYAFDLLAPQAGATASRDERLRAVALALRHQGAPTTSPAPGDERALRLYQAAILALGQLPAMIDAAELALSFGPQFTIHTLAPPAARAVEETDLHQLPADPPRMLRRAWFAEARTGALFGETASLGGLPRPDGALLLVGQSLSGGAFVTRWAPAWGEEEIRGVGAGMRLLLQGVEAAAWTAWGGQAARFATMLALLLEAEGTPLRWSDRGGRLPSGATPGPGKGWTDRYVTISDPLPAAAARPHAGHAPAPLDGRAEAVVPVTGHLKQQPHGPGRSLRKTIYVAGYSARRWVAPEARVHVL